MCVETADGRGKKSKVQEGVKVSLAGTNHAIEDKRLVTTIAILFLCHQMLDEMPRS